MSLPTRVTYGINTFPKSSPSHCKLEVFLPPSGWVSFDISETQKLCQGIRGDNQIDAKRKEQWIDAAHRRLLAGYRDNTWILQTRGSDYDLVPAASKRVAVVRTIYAEADGAALKDPDPSNKDEHAFAWMTASRFRSDRKVSYPFQDTSSLDRWLKSNEHSTKENSP
jgi:hypothetical protein